MARDFLSPIKIVNVSALPAAGTKGRVICLTTNGHIYADNGTSWDDLASVGSGSPGGSNTQIQYNNAGAFGGASQLFWDEVNKRLGISIAPLFPLHIRDYSVTELTYQYGTLLLKRTGTNSFDSPVIEFYRAAGTVAAPTAAANGDQIGDFTFRVHDGTDYLPNASFGVKAEGAGLGGQFVWRTDNVPQTDGIVTDRFFITANGNIVIGTAALATNATNGFLYVAAGAGPPTGVPTAYDGRVPLYVDSTNNKLYQYTNANWIPVAGNSALNNASVANQTINAGVTALLTGSAISVPAVVPASKLRVGTVFKYKILVTKTAAGTAANTFVFKLGASGTTADATILTFTLPVGTAAVDDAEINIDVTIRSIGFNTAVAQGSLRLVHNLAATGFSTLPGVVLKATSAAFDSTVSLIASVACTTAAATVLTFSQVNAEAVNL